MNVSTLPAILDALSTGALSGVVSGLLVLFAPMIAVIPGFRPSDATRNTLMRVLLYVLTLGAIIGLAWSQHIVIAQSDWPMVLIAAGLGSGSVHLLYTGIKTRATTAAQTSTAAPAPDPLALATEAVNAVQAAQAVSAATPAAS